MTDLAPTELGRLLEEARAKTDGTGISLREAGRRAGFTEGAWRQLVRRGRGPGATVVAAALAVGADPAQALTAAGLPGTPDAVRTFTEGAQRAKARPAGAVTGLADEIERVRALPLDAKERLRVTREIISMYEDLAREQEEPVEKGT
jgi:hypothetical protein